MKLFFDESFYLRLTLQTGRCVRRIYSHSRRASERTNNRQRLSSPSNRASVRSYAYFSRSRGDSPAVFPARQSLVEIATVVRVGSAQHYFRVGSQWTTFLPIPLRRVRPVLSRARGPSSRSPVPYVSPSLSLLLSYLKTTT